MEADFFDIGEKCLLYRDGEQIAWARSPAVFRLADLPSSSAPTAEGANHPESDARIEVHMGWYGMRRAHIVTAAEERHSPRSPAPSKPGAPSSTATTPDRAAC